MTDPDDLRSRAKRLIGNFNPYSWASLVLLIVGIAYYLLIPYQVDKPMLFFGQALMDMKPTLFPTIAGIGLIVTSVLALAQSLVNPETNPFKDLSLALLIQIGVILVILYIFALAFEPIGFVISAILTTAALSLYLGNRSPLKLAILALGIPGVVYLIFTKLLFIALPEGLLY